MRNRLPSLNALRAFDAVARHGSFTRAAEELCVTHGAVSRHIAVLEDTLGLKLFIRGPREVRLTHAAVAYAKTVQDAFDTLRSATEMLTTENEKEPLRIKGSQIFVLRWLMPKLPELDGMPLDIGFDDTDYPMDLDHHEVDFSIKAGPSSRPGTVSYKLMDLDFIPICNPRNVNGKPPPKQVSDLLGYTLLYPGRSLDLKNEQSPWDIWLQGAGLDVYNTADRSYFATSDLIYRAAAKGFGIGMGAKCFLTDELGSGELITPFDISVRATVPYYLVIPEVKLEEPRVVAFRDWMMAKAQSGHC